MDLTVKSSTWCLLHHAQKPKDNYYDHYGQDGEVLVSEALKEKFPSD
jgi:hypothetical protein